MKTALFTGSFNPFTIGHADIVERALTLFDSVVIGVGINPDKKEDNIEERVKQIQTIYKDNDRITVEAYSDLTADLAKRHNATAIIKGVRSVKDFEYEREQADFNKMLGDGLETIFFFSKPEYSSISSSMLRALQHFGKDISKFLP